MNPYTVRVGPYTHLIHSDGTHEVVGKDRKQPQRFYLDESGCYHVAAETANLPREDRAGNPRKPGA